MSGKMLCKSCSYQQTRHLDLIPGLQSQLHQSLFMSASIIFRAECESDFEGMTDNEKLMKLQTAFLNGDSGVWSELWTYSCNVAKRIVKSESKKKGFWICEDDTYDLTMEAVLYVLRRFRQKKSYKVKKNFFSALYLGCVHSIYHRTKAEKLEAELYSYLNSQNPAEHPEYMDQRNISKILYGLRYNI